MSDGQITPEEINLLKAEVIDARFSLNTFDGVLSGLESVAIAVFTERINTRQADALSKLLREARLTIESKKKLAGLSADDVQHSTIRTLPAGMSPAGPFGILVGGKEG